MKKTTLLFVLFSITFLQIKAQLSEDFEGAFPPTDWTTDNKGSGTSIDWESSSDSFTGVKAAFIDYDASGSTEDWLISPPFTPDTDNNTLTFYQKQDLDEDYFSTYTIRVKNITDGLDFEIIDTQSETDFGTSYSLHSVELSAYDGKEIQVAFVFSQFDGDSWYIDKVSTVDPTSDVPDCAENHLPIDGDTDVTNLAGDVFISWFAPSAGDVVPCSYDVYVGSTANNLSKVTETANTNYTLTGMAYETEYFWKIVPKNYAIGTLLCDTRSFTTQIENTSRPINDSCSTAISISATPYENTQDATHATNNGPDPGGFVWACDGESPTGGMNDGVWYTFTTIIGGTVNIDITNVSSAFDVEVAVYSGTCGNFTCTGFKDTAATGEGASESLTVDVDPETKYWVNVGSNSAELPDVPEGAFKITLSLGAGVTLGVKDIETKLSVSLYPNPTNGILNMNYKDAIDVVYVFNLMGQKVESIFPNRKNSQINMSNLPSGMYVVEIQSKEKKGSYRVIKR